MKGLGVLTIMGIASLAFCAEPKDTYEMTVIGGASHALADRPSQSTSQKTAHRRGARSTTDALRYTPGVSVQRTGHGQASAFIRGLTGRRTLLLFDGLRINNALFRQGPNQYLFTVDELTVKQFEVVRGGASVRLGSNAMGGAVLLHPRLPTLDPTAEGVVLRPGVFARHATADQEKTAKLSLDAQLTPKFGARVGVGLRDLGQLESGGRVKGLLERTEESEVQFLEKAVPRLESDGRTQMGTGYDALTADAQLLYRPSPSERITLAFHTFRQSDAPRTDQCPPPEAPDTWCLNYDEQHRTHAYLRADLEPGLSLADDLSLGLSYARQHERRTNFRDSFESIGRDDVDVYSAMATAKTPMLLLADAVGVKVEYGADARYEHIDSVSFQTLIARFSDRPPITRERPRGQYLSGSDFSEASAFVHPTLYLGRHLSFRGGVRGTYSKASAPAEALTDSTGIERDWLGVSSNAGVAWRPTEALGLLLNFEQGYRAPNLDDLTGRQLTGQGFQIENPDLSPERSRTLELGLEWRARRVSGGIWLFNTWLDDPMLRVDAQCPEDTTDSSCRAGGANRRLPVRLVNADTVRMHGVEADFKVRIVRGLTTRGALSWVRPDQTPVLTAGDVTPTTLSRIPPLSANLEIDYAFEAGPRIGLAGRWADDADLLSYGDTLDARIPPGGTPGYLVLDARLGIDLGQNFRLNAVFENLTDAAYRIHGSSLNEAGRGVVATLEWNP